MNASSETLEVPPTNLPAGEACERCRPEGDAIMIDVRTPAEYQEVHVEGSYLLPLHELSRERVEALEADGKALLLMCRSGKRAAQAQKELAGLGIAATVVEGGIEGWMQEDQPVNRGRKVISLERQVRIAAGSLVLLGVGLSFAFGTGWLGLSAFVGAGLVFAGITDTCGMGMMLARMPWNQRR